MPRLCFLVVLMVLGSSAHAGNSFSFVVGGHRIRIEAPRHCHSPSCVSVSIPGIHQARRGEAVLVNMKPKTGAQWTGKVYSHDSGDTYYGTMALKGPNALRVEACALGRFYCSGNNWSRIDAKPEKLVTSRQLLQAPRS